MFKRYCNVLLALIVAIVFSVIIYKNVSTDKNIQTTIKPSLEDVVARVANAEDMNPETSTWKEYTSEKFSIKFKYPSTLFVFEGRVELYDTYIITLYENTPENHHYAENINDLDSDFEDLNKIGISVTPLEGDFIISDFMNKYDSSTKWQEVVFKGHKAIAVTGTASMMGSDYPYDGLTVLVDKKVYSFGVPHWPEDVEGNDQSQQVRNDYYKILSTLEFLK